MRKMRESRTEEEHLLDNENAKDQMKLAKENGFKKPFKRRLFREIDEIYIWKNFINRGIEFFNVLNERNSEMASKAKEILDKEKKERMEREEKERKEREKGYWEENPADGNFFWTGKEPPGPDNPNPLDMEPEPELNVWEGEPDMTDDEWDELQFKWYTEMVNERKNQEREERNRIAREKYKEKKDRHAKPIEVPDLEKSEYEKIRDQIVKEREEALMKAGWHRTK